MPKGVYPRTNKSGMNVVATEAPVTPETANANVVQVVSQSGDDSEMSTTQRLFGDLTNADISQQMADLQEPVPQSPMAVPEPVAPVVEKPPEPVASEPAAQQSTQTPDDSFDIEKVLNKKIKAKVDGKEEEVTLKDLRDNYQINKHLAQAADKVGEERRKLAEERRQIQEWRQQRQQNIPSEPTGFQPGGMPNGNGAMPQIPQELNPLLAKINSLEQQLNQFVEGTRPAVFQSNRQRVADELKSQGFDDFLQFIPKMETHLVGLSNQNPQLVQFYDTPDGAKALYFQLKAQELVSRQHSAPPVQQVAPNVPVVPQTRVESGAQPSGSVNDDGASNYRRAFKRATELANDTPAGREAWNQVLLQKGIIPGE